MPGQPFEISTRAQVVALKARGLSVDEIRADTGVSAGGIKHIWNKAVKRGYNPEESRIVKDVFLKDGKRTGRPRKDGKRAGDVPEEEDEMIIELDEVEGEQENRLGPNGEEDLSAIEDALVRSLVGVQRQQHNSRPQQNQRRQQHAQRRQPLAPKPNRIPAHMAYPNIYRGHLPQDRWLYQRSAEYEDIDFSVDHNLSGTEAYLPPSNADFPNVTHPNLIDPRLESGPSTNGLT